MQRRGLSWWVVGFLAIVFVVALYFLRAVLTPVFFAFLVAYILDPTVDQCERVMPRWLGIVLILTGLLAATVLFFFLVVPGIVSDVSKFAQELPARVSASFNAWEPYLVAHGVPVPHSFDEVITQFGANTQGVASTVSPLTAAVSWIVGGTASIVSAFGRGVIVPVIAFYLLLDFDNITASMRDLLPARFRRTTLSIVSEIDTTLGQFVRGQVTVMLILGTLYAVGYSIIGVRLAIPIGIVAGLLAFIPYVGGGLGLGLALLMCAFEGSLSSMGYVLVWFFVVQGMDGLFITPKIVGDKVGLSAVWVLIALMIGGELFGFMGVLLALPAAAVTKIFVMRGLTRYRASELFGGGAGEELKAAIGLSDHAELSAPDDLRGHPSADERVDDTKSETLDDMHDETIEVDPPAGVARGESERSAVAKSEEE